MARRLRRARPRPDLPGRAVAPPRSGSRRPRRASRGLPLRRRRRWASPARATRWATPRRQLVARLPGAHRRCRSASGSACARATQAAEVAGFADGVIVGSAFVTAADRGGPARRRATAPPSWPAGVAACGLRPAGGLPTPADATVGGRRDTVAGVSVDRRGGRCSSCLHPEPGPRRLVCSARSRSAPTRCASSPASSSPSCWGERRFVARGGAAGHGHRRRGVRRAVRAGRRPALPRHHRLADLLRPGRRPARRAADLGGRARDLGRRRARRRSGPGSAAAAAACRCPFFADAVAPGIVVAQAIGRLGNWFNQELYGAPTTLPWGLEIYRRVDPATGLPDPLGGVALDHTPIAGRAPHVPLRAAVEPAVAGLVVWADRRFRLGHGRAFARLRRRLHARPVLDRADAHRPRHPRVRRHPDQRRGLGGRVRRRGGLPRAGAQAARGAATRPRPRTPGPGAGARRGAPAAAEPTRARPARPRRSHGAQTGPHAATGDRRARRSPGSARAPSSSTTACSPTTPRPTGPTSARVYETRRPCADAGAARRRWSRSSAPARSSGRTATSASPTTRPRTRRTAAPPPGPFYVQIGADGLLAAGGYYRMAPDQVARFRTAVDDERRGGDLEKRLAALEPDGITMAGEHAQAPARAASTRTTRGWTCCGTGPLRARALGARRRAARAGHAGPGGGHVAGAAAAHRVARRPRGTAANSQR